MKQRTLVLIKPDALHKNLAGAVITRLEPLNLECVAMRLVKVTPELVAQHYPHLTDKPFYPDLVNFMCGKLHPRSHGKMWAFVFEGEDAINKVRDAAGATMPEKAASTSIRGSMGRTVNGVVENLIHASANEEDYVREAAIWVRPEDFA